MASYRDIGAYQGTAGSGNDIGALQAAAGAPPAEEGQVIMIMSKLIIPFMWIKQGKGNRRQFIRNTIASIFGM